MTMQREIWDAYNAKGELLGFDLYRDEAEQIPKGVYHMVVDIYTFTIDREVLITQRAPEKTFPLTWEVTGGSVLKGETPEQGAYRELLEETGISACPNQFYFLFTEIMDNRPVIYKTWLALIEKDKIQIHLQMGETVAYRFISYEVFRKQILSGGLGDSLKQRFAAHVGVFDRFTKSLL